MKKYNISYMDRDGEIINISIMATSIYNASNKFYKQTGIWTNNCWVA